MSPPAHLSSVNALTSDFRQDQARAPWTLPQQTDPPVLLILTGVLTGRGFSLHHSESESTPCHRNTHLFLSPQWLPQSLIWFLSWVSFSSTPKSDSVPPCLNACSSFWLVLFRFVSKGKHWTSREFSIYTFLRHPLTTLSLTKVSSRVVWHWICLKHSQGSIIFSKSFAGFGGFFPSSVLSMGWASGLPVLPPERWRSQSALPCGGGESLLLTPAPNSSILCFLHAYKIFHTKCCFYIDSTRESSLLTLQGYLAIMTENAH